MKIQFKHQEHQSDAVTAVAATPGCCSPRAPWLSRFGDLEIL